MPAPHLSEPETNTHAQVDLRLQFGGAPRQPLGSETNTLARVGDHLPVRVETRWATT